MAVRSAEDKRKGVEFGKLLVQVGRPVGGPS